MRHDPLVSVIIAARNAELYLAEAIGSVVQQTWTDHETIVVDGASTDATASIARSFPRVRHVMQDGLGFAAAWNQGIDAAHGDVLAFLDSDDRWAPDKLERQMFRLTRTPRVDAVIGRVRFFVGHEEPLPSFRRELLGRDHVGHMPGTLLARRSVFDVVGRFGTSWEIASDVDWFARLKDSDVPVAAIPEVVLHKRVHGTNLSYLAARTPLVRREILLALKQSADRQRGRA